MSILPWHKDKLLGFDLETTGVNPHDDRIVTASIVYLAGVLRPKIYTWVIDPGIDIPDEAANIHGWTTKKVRAHPDVRPPEQAIFEIVGKLAYTMHRAGAPLVAFNAAYDLTLLEAECRRHDIDPLTSRLERGIRPVVDPFVLDKHVSRRRGSRKLVDQCAHYGVLLGDAHSADADATAACRLVTRMVEREPKLQTYSLETLHDHQVGWRSQQQASLRAYFDRMGKEHDGCDGGWPIQAAPAGVTS